MIAVITKSVLMILALKYQAKNGQLDANIEFCSSIKQSIGC